VGGRSGLLESCTSGEFRDSASLALPGVQQQLVEAVVATGTPAVVVVVSGRVHALPWICQHARAVLLAWPPGQEGGHALADVLFGAVSPSGRLPISLPRSVGQVPVYYAHKSGAGRSQIYGDYVDCPKEPLYPFGHGLAYTRFGYANLRVSPQSAGPGDVVEVAIDVTNEGDRAGDEVVQLYVRDMVASVTRPVKQLAGFARVPLAPGETRRVHFALDPSQLAFFDARMRFVIEPGEFRVMVGASSADVRAEGGFELGGGVTVRADAHVVPTGVRVE
jgi:beta-glucosidase